ncbi:MAG: hypothetical protein H0T42_25515 [Deltaproteobacteria bacterium]|nr:hypothetical protein [Deltaproteobacteria bacterium]
MTTDLVARRTYLDPQRRTIVARAIAGSLAGLVPIPFLDDWAKAAVLGGGYKRIAAAHGVDLDDDAVKSLVHGKTPPPSIAQMAASGIMYRIAGLAAKRMLLALATVNRVRAASRTFTTMTLFDHYCARLHIGPALDGPTALAVREEISRAIDQTPGALSFHPFRRGLSSAARSALKATLELADLASGGALRRLLTKKSESAPITEAEAVNDVEKALETQLANQGGFLARTVAAVEVQLSADGNPFLDGAIEALDRRWRARRLAGIE